MPSLVKQGNATVGELGNIATLEVDLEFEQEGGKGAFGKLRNRFQPADPDLSAVVYAGQMPVNYCDPKSEGHRSILSGAVVHHGDGRGQGIETISFRCSEIESIDSDVTGFGLFASCADGFRRIAGATARLYDASKAERRHIGNVRFNLLGEHRGALLGILTRGPDDTWTFRSEPKYGHGVGWRELASLATAQMPRA